MMIKREGVVAQGERESSTAKMRIANEQDKMRKKENNT